MGQPDDQLQSQDDSTEVSVRARVAQWHSEFSNDLRMFVWGLLRDWELTADTEQSVFQKAIESFDEIDHTHVRGWLFRVAYHHAMWLKRKAGVRARGREGWISRAMVGMVGARTPESPLNYAQKKEEIVKLKQALVRLPDDQRIVVEKRMHSDKTFAEIAEELGVPLGTVLTRMRLALEKLRVAFDIDKNDQNPL